MHFPFVIWNGEEQLGLLVPAEAQNVSSCSCWGWRFGNWSKAKQLGYLRNKLGSYILFPVLPLTLEIRPKFWHGVSDHRSLGLPSSTIRKCPETLNVVLQSRTEMVWFELGSSLWQSCQEEEKIKQEEFPMALLHESSYLYLHFPSN